MFRQRRSSQKPADALLANFRQQFPELNTTSSASPTQAAVAPVSAADNPLLDATLSDDSNTNIAPGPAFQQDEPTPRASNEPWRLTPSFMDPNSFNFNQFANAPPGYYTPTPGVGMSVPGLGTPLSMPASGAVPAGAGPMDPGGFQPLQTHGMHHFNPFVQVAAPPPPQSYAPSSFVHQDTGYETMEQDGSPMQPNRNEDRMTSIDSAIHGMTPTMGFQPGQMSHHMSLPPSAEKFRFHSTLNAPTAMIKQSDEIPVTYLNKGQAYSLSIADTHAMMPVAPGTKFRTFVRISFEDEEQRQKPGICWSLWKEGRGANEAHQRGGKLQAVEYVEASQHTEGDDKRTRVELETSSFDGFSVTWSPGTMGVPETNLGVRFNFLSTDFSHSKGVKGIPVRLCAKTTIVSESTTQSPTDTSPEICFCKVKLFRDHGAERKLSNDVAHVKKSIDKVKHQIAQAESGLKDFGKRGKRANQKPKIDPQRVGKAPKHKRTWSMSSGSSDAAGGGRTTAEDDLHIKLQTLQDMFTSTRPVSVLYLRGEEQDDPDLHPVTLSGDAIESKSEPGRDGTTWQPRENRNSTAGSIVSPAPSSLSLASQQSMANSAGQWQQPDIPAGAEKRKMSESVTKVQKTSSEGKPSGWIEAVGVDQTYRPPPERTPKPVACFYVLRPEQNGSNKQEYYQAVYLYQRSIMDLNRRVAQKFGIDINRIQRTLHVLQSGLEVEMDDDVVQNLSEGQDMLMQVGGVDPAVKQEWEMAVDGTPTQETPNALSGELVLRLTF